MPRGTRARTSVAATVTEEPEVTSSSEATEAPAEAPTVFEWGDPPPAPKVTHRGRGVSSEQVAKATALRENQGSWAKISEHEGDARKNRAYQTAARVRTGAARAYEKDKFETVARELPNGNWAVFARFTDGSHIPPKVESVPDLGDPASEEEAVA